MILPPFRYAAPRTMAEAFALLEEDGGGMVPLAGGTDLLVMMKEKYEGPAGLMSLRHLAELRGIRSDDGRVTMGAAQTVASLGADALPAENPAFADLLHVMATPQIRNRATIGGNLCTAAACADFPPVLLINDAEVLLQGNAVARTMALADFHEGVRQVARKKHELLVSVTCRRRNPGSAYLKFGVRNAANISIVAVAACVEVEDNRVSRLKVSTTAASPVPTLGDEVSLGMRGESATDATWKKAADAVVASLAPICDLRGSAEYRMDLARVGVVRALRLAYSRLGRPPHA